MSDMSKAEREEICSDPNCRSHRELHRMREEVGRLENAGIHLTERMEEEQSRANAAERTLADLKKESADFEKAATDMRDKWWQTETDRIEANNEARHLQREIEREIAHQRLIAEDAEVAMRYHAEADNGLGLAAEQARKMAAENVIRRLSQLVKKDEEVSLSERSIRAMERAREERDATREDWSEE